MASIMPFLFWNIICSGFGITEITSFTYALIFMVSWVFCRLCSLSGLCWWSVIYMRCRKCFRFLLGMLCRCVNCFVSCLYGRLRFWHHHLFIFWQVVIRILLCYYMDDTKVTLDFLFLLVSDRTGYLDWLGVSYVIEATFWILLSFHTSIAETICSIN